MNEHNASKIYRWPIHIKALKDITLSLAQRCSDTLFEMISTQLLQV